MFEIKRYTPDEEELWNEFNARAHNGTFLTDRRFMDYHASRFTDFSLLFYKNTSLYALLPANRADNTLHSHQGLTYGGLLIGNNGTAAYVRTLFQELNEFLKKEGIERVIYKHIPWFYSEIPSEEDLYVLVNTCAAGIYARSISSVINLQASTQLWQKKRMGDVRKAQKAGLTIAKSKQFDLFWQLLTYTLQTRHGVFPVHSLEEINLLAGRFPENIVLYTVSAGEELVGGTVLFVHQKHTVHVQYIATSEKGKQLKALDFLFHDLIFNRYKDYKFFDFGISTEQQGQRLNEGLIWQKEGFGARGVCYDIYEWQP